MDLVEIGFKINSKQVATAVDRVDKLLDKSKKLATETEKTGKKVKQSNDAVVNSNQKKLSTIEKEIAVTKKAQELEKQGLTKAQARKVATHEYTGALKSQIKALIDVYKEQNKANASIKKSIEVTDNSAKSTLREAASIQRANTALREKITVSTLVNSLMKEGLSVSQANSLATMKVAGADQSLISARKKQILAFNSAKQAKEEDILASNKVAQASAKTSKQIEREVLTLEYLQKGYSKTTATKMANAKISGVSASEVSRLGAAAKATENYTKAQNRLRISSKGATDVISNVMLSFKLAIIMQGTIELIKMADAMELLRSRAALVSPVTKSVNEIMGRLVETSMETRASLLDTVTLYNRLTPSLSRYGRTTEDVFKVIDTFNNSLLVSGATARETASAILQFSQSMAAGKLAGDEFRSVTEAAPELLNAIAKGSGYARDQLKDMSKNGLLTTKLVSEALIKTWEEMGEKAKEIPVNIGQAVTNLKTSFSFLVSLVNQSTGATSKFAQQINSMAYDIKAFAENLRAGNYDEQIDKIVMLTSSITGAAVALKSYNIILGLYSAATDLAVKSTKGFTKVLRLNPLVAATSIVIGVASAIGMMGDTTVDTGRKVASVSSLVTSTFNVISGRITKIIERNKEIIDLLMKHSKKFVERVKKMVSAIVSIYNSILKAMFDFHKAVLNGVISLFIGGYSAAKTLMKRILDLVVTGGTNLGIGLKTAFDMAMSGDFSLDNFKKSFSKSMKKSIYTKDITDDVKSAFTKEFETDWVGDAIVTPLEKAADVVKGVGAIIKRDTLNLIDEVIDGAEKLDKVKKEQMGKGGSPAADAPIDEFRDKTAQLQIYLDKLIEVNNAEMAGYLTLERGAASSLADAQARKLVNEQIEATTAFLKEQMDLDMNPLKEVADFDFSTIFGEIGNPFGDAIKGATAMVDVMQKNATVMNTLISRKEELESANKSTAEVDTLIAKAQRKNVKDELKGTANVVGATKNMFKEKTVAYKVLANVERGYRMMELSMSIAAMSQKQAETANAVANDAAVAGSSATASLASSMVGLPFPLNLAAFAATGALLASIGLFGGGSGSSSSGGITLEDRQEAQSTGGVLGSSTTKTESITKSFDLMTNYMSDTVKATSGTFREVSKLNNSIGNLGSALFKGLNFQDGLIEFNKFSGYSNKAGKTLGGVGDSRLLKGILSLGTSELPLVGGYIGGAGGDAFRSLGEGLFGKTKIKKVNEGIQIAGDSFASIMEQGTVDAFAWANIKIKKKSWFKSSTKYKTITEGLSSGIESAFGEVLGGIYTSIEEAVKVLGFGDMSKAVFEGLKVSTMGMSDEDALAEIQAAFANVADTTVLQVLPSMVEFQKTGEALAETLMRVATQTTVFSDYLDVLGMTRLQGTVSEDRAFYNYWTQQEDTRTVDVRVNLRDTKYAEEFAKFSDELAEAAGGLEPFTEGLSNLLDVMLTDAQQFERVENALSEGLKGFSNYSWLDTVIYKLPETREGLDALQKKMLEAGDTEAFAWLLNNAEMIGDYYDQLEDYVSTAYDFDTSFGLNNGLDPLKDALKDVGKDFESVKEVAESTGKEGLGELFKSLTDVQKTALEPFIDTILELVPAVEDVEKTVKSFQDVSMKIRDYLEKLKVSPDSGTPVDIAQEALKQYRELVEKAKGGDLEAAQALTGSASTLIKLSKDAYASGAIFQDIYAEIKKSLGDVADMADVASIEQLNYNVNLAQLGKLHEIAEYMKNGTTPWVPEPEPVPEPVVPELDFSGMDFGNIGVIDFGNMGFGLGGIDLSGWDGRIDLGLGPMFAKGGVFTNSIVDTATPFNMGVMGEAGPEAIMPLSRSSNGELGVRVVSGGGTDTSPIVAEIQGSNKNLQALVRLQQASNQRILEKLDSIDNRLEGVEEKTRLQARI